MSIIDAHTHAFPNDIAARAMAKLQGEGDIPAYGDGTVRGLLKSMDAADIDVSVVCAIATKPAQAEGILKWCQKIHSDRIEPLASVHPDDPEAARWIERIAEAGLAGIKLHPMYQEFAADDPRADAIYAAASENSLIVACHCGLDLCYPPDDDRASPVRFAEVIRKHPDLRLLCTHMGGWRSWDFVENYLLGKNVWLETSFSLDELGPQRAVGMMRRHGAGKIMFGSDWPWKDQADTAKILRALPLTEKEFGGILFSNASAMLGY